MASRRLKISKKYVDLALWINSWNNVGQYRNYGEGIRPRCIKNKLLWLILTTDTALSEAKRKTEIDYIVAMKIKLMVLELEHYNVATKDFDRNPYNMIAYQVAFDLMKMEVFSTISSDHTNELIRIYENICKV